MGSSREALPKNVVEGLYGLGSCPGVDLPTFLDSVLEIGLMETGADAGGAIFVTDRTGKQLFWSFKALLGTPRRPRQELVREWSGHALAPAIRRLGHEFIPVVSLASGDSKGYTLFEESRFAAWVPIIQRESEVGWLQLETRAPEAFSQRSLPVLAELARHAGRLVRRLLVRDHGAAHGHDVHMVGRSPRLLALERQLELLAADPRSPVLLCGERGSGKELAAYAVHYFSPRCDGPFIAINSAAFTPELIPDALFGHTRGAFSGADDVRGGIFHEAEGGSLFFDEIGDMPLHVQASLLRALDRGEIRPVGADRPRRVDVRILAATNRDLHAMMEEGTFRRDLFDRLDVFRVTVPPLRDRPEDLRLLADFFLRRACAENGRSGWMHDRNACVSCSRSAGRVCADSGFHEALAEYEFPGNVRELRNVVFRLAAVVREELRPGHVHDLCAGRALRDEATPDPGDEAEPLRLEAAVRSHIHRVLEMAEGNKSQAARLLGLPLSTLYNKLKRLDMV